MANVELANCKRCKSMFQRPRGGLDRCQPCLANEEETFSKLYRTLQRSQSQGGIIIDELASEVSLSAAEITEIMLTGQLGTMADFIKYPCKSCGAVIDHNQRGGRFCLNCSEEKASIAGVAVKSIRELDQAKAEQQEKQDLMAILKGGEPKEGLSTRRYGLGSR